MEVKDENTLALILYGDLDISIIDELPPNRKKIETYAVTKGMEQRVNSFIKKQIDEKKSEREAYIKARIDEINEAKGKKFNESNNNLTKKEDNKKNQDKKIKIKFKKYCNAFNVSNNKLTTIEGIHIVLESLLPELSFSSKLTKVQLIQWIDISRNKLTSIHKDICELPYLKILYVHGNNIQEIGKVTALGNCKSLTSLTLYGNPMDHIKGYRNFIIEMCPLLEKLDGAVISEKELDVIKFHGSRFGEVRDKKGAVKKYPKLPEEIIKTLQLAEQNSQEKKDDN